MLMGLDMYLSKKTYVKNWQHEPEDGHYTVAVSQGGRPRNDIKPARIEYIVEGVADWRKANAVHAWFVKNAQDGKDDCRAYPVTREQLTQLREACAKVLAASTLIEGKITNGYRYENGKETPILENGKLIKDATVAKKILPTHDGFFFGSTGYDQYYCDDLVTTRDVLDKVLAEQGDHFEYQASW